MDGSVIVSRGMSRPDRDEQNFCYDMIVSVY